MKPDYYDTNCRDYFSKTSVVDPAPFLSVVADHLPAGSKVLDIGCGSGRDLLWLKKRGFQPTGFERSPGLAELAQKHAGCPVIEGDFMHYDFSRIQYDAILLIGAFVHLQKKELAPVLAGVARAVRDEGLIYLTLKEGTGIAQGTGGRLFTLWQQEDLEAILASLPVSVLDVTRNKSPLNKDDTWLGYLLKKERRRDHVRQV